MKSLSGYYENYSFFIVFCAFSNASLAFSELYDFEAGVVLKNGIPCFYSKHALKSSVPQDLQGEGVSLSVFDEKSKKYNWEVWMKSRPNKLPVSPESCMLYGLISPDKNDTLAMPVSMNTPYLFFMSGEMGRQAVFFCVNKKISGEFYLSRTNGQGACTNEKLVQDEKRGFWYEIFNR